MTERITHWPHAIVIDTLMYCYPPDVNQTLVVDVLGSPETEFVVVVADSPRSTYAIFRIIAWLALPFYLVATGGR
ncbi:MAG: hypothetical protein IH969_08065 [Candidatus Krumholzibacteriota bacterium]|nr:hypothetical protein [Candidatus Krumholzibacteriota bacterium]